MAQDEKTYTIPAAGTLAGMLRTSRRLLPDAVASFSPSSIDVHGAAIQSGGQFGCVAGAFDSPFRNDIYIVEFVQQNTVRILAYLDQFGRVFSIDEPVEAPPARQPDLEMRKYADASTDLLQEGCFLVKTADGEMRRVATYVKRESLYSITDSWYDFGLHSKNLSYAEAMARVYLACVYRPQLTGIPVPTNGLDSISELLRATNPTRGIRAIRLLVERAMSDPALQPPALARLLVKWLDEAGFTERASHGWLYSVSHDDEGGPLRLIRTRRYADTYYLAAQEGVDIPPATIWAVESALNRFLLLKETFGDDGAATATVADCAQWDERLRDTIALQAPLAEHPDDEDAESPAGEWDVRLSIGKAMERLRLPYRYRGLFHVDMTEPGTAALLLTVPDASLMPAQRYDAEQEDWMDRSMAQRRVDAFSYATHLGIALAAAAFAASRAIQTVTVTAIPLTDDSEAGKLPSSVAESLAEERDAESGAHAADGVSAETSRGEHRTIDGMSSSRGGDQEPMAGAIRHEGDEAREMPSTAAAAVADIKLPGVLGHSDEAKSIPWARGVVRLTSPQDAISATEAAEAELAANPPSSPMRKNMPASPGSPGESVHRTPFYYQVTYDREDFCYKEAYRLAAAADPLPFLEFFGARMGDEAAYDEPFASVTERDSFEYRTRAPELESRPLTDSQQRALGTTDAEGLRISYDADMRFVGDRLAESLRHVSSVQDAIHLVLEEQNTTGDPLVFQGCTRLMTALTQGTIDAHDRVQVSSCFEGEDPYSEALRQARQVVQVDPQRAAQILAGAIAESQASGRYTDTPEAVHRMFDSYGSRIYYNLHRSDGDKKVALVPPSLLMCYLDAINLLDESFTQSEDAVGYGTRCIQMAPTFALAYRRCARAYMLVGDLDNASKLLIECLRFAAKPEEIAMAYYQLAYVEWKGGHAEEGLACYCKSIMTSPIYAAQSTLELRELMREEGLDILGGREIDQVLEEADIPLAPTEEVLNEMGDAIEASVNANLFSVARSLLTTYMLYRPDDAYANVLRSLDDPRVESLLGA